MKLKYVFLCLMPVLVSGCSFSTVSGVQVDLPDSAIQLHKTMIGTWYGNQPTRDGGRQFYVVKRYPNGLYTVDFSFRESDGGLDEYQEYGIWGVSGPIYFNVTGGWIRGGEEELANAEDPHNYVAYQIKRLTKDEFQYQSYKSGSLYKVRRVSEDFTSPELQSASSNVPLSPKKTSLASIN